MIAYKEIPKKREFNFVSLWEVKESIVFTPAFVTFLHLKKNILGTQS